MAVLLRPPKFQFVNSAGQPYAGGTLEFYLTGTSTPEPVYSDENLNGPATTRLLNSAGWPETDIFPHPEKKYKVILKDSAGNQIWVVDPVSTTDLARVPLWSVVAGDPNGHLAGTAASPGVQPSIAWSSDTQILYVCTTTGTASTADWTAINAQSATPAVSAPQGYLSTSTNIIPIADQLDKTQIFYFPFFGNLIPIYNGSRLVPTEFTDLTLTLASAHAASTIYDVFVFSNLGVPTLVTGPAWQTSTAGSGARGTGAGTTELTRLNGYWVNAVQISARNGANTFTVGANLATYVGSIFIDSTQGQVTCHRSFGQSRKWGIWNAYNRQPLYLKAGDSTASWSYKSATVRPSNNNTANSLTVFSGLAEEFLELGFKQRISTSAATGDLEAYMGVGWNSTTALSGSRGSVGFRASGESNIGVLGHGVARLFQAPALGVNVVGALENGDNGGGSITRFGTEADMLLSAMWRG